MGDRKSGAAFHEAFKGVLNEHFGFGVNRRCGFVQDEDTRVVEDGAGDGDALFFAAG